MKQIERLLNVSALCILSVVATGCIHGSGGGGGGDAKDKIVITSSNEFNYGSLKTSCSGLAMPYN